MSETLKRVIHLPKRLKNPLQRASDEQMAVDVLASLNSLPHFQDHEDELTDVIKAVKHPPVTPEQKRDLGHPTRDIERTLRILESRVITGALPEVTAQKYLEELRLQRELSLQRPPSLARRIGSKLSKVNPVAAGVFSGVVVSAPVGLVAPYDSIENYLIRTAFASLASTGYLIWRRKHYNSFG